ncbi:lebercilin [Venturia canescens]|uniref:lebercilin n=1 Tax=Venturia canescens TaxID=32260 RepID=UPI001C9C9FD3|nr:lebercilin [Venturia canescens]
MQSEVPSLSVVYSDGKKRSARDTDLNDQTSNVQVTNHNACKFSTNLVSNRKQLHPLVGGPYRNSMRLYALTEPIRSTNKSSVGQRVMSAKMLRVKQLQNQLSDAHYHLNELSNENRLLKALQKRQDSALRKYEGKNAELPRIINSHHEELKVLQTKYKKLRMQHKQTCDLLKEKETEIYSLQVQNKHLTQLSKDRHLEEREKLQMRVSDLNFRIEQQQETIQTLNRKLALESKSLKHQLNAEVAKHRETQKHLNETLEKLKNLEDLLDNREKRLYYSGRLPVCNKGKSMESQSLMNLRQNSGPPNALKSIGKSGGSQNEPEHGSLPKLTRTESSEGKTIPNPKEDQREGTPVTETMSTLQQVRKFRLQKSYSRNGSASLLNVVDKEEEEETTANEINLKTKYSRIEKLRTKRLTMNEVESDGEEEIKKFVNNFEATTDIESYKLPEELMKEFGYSSTDSKSDADEENIESGSLASKSRDLHTRLIADDTDLVRQPAPSEVTKMRKPPSHSESESDTEDRLRNDRLSTPIEDYGVVLQSEKENAQSLVQDFSKIDINRTHSDSEMERANKTHSEAFKKSEDVTSSVPSSEGHENNHQRLLEMTKSWSEVQAKIKRDREISESQLKALNEGILEDELEIKLINEDRGYSSIRTENLENPEKEIFRESLRSPRKIEKREETFEIPQAQRNGVEKTEFIDCPENFQDDAKTYAKQPAENYLIKTSSSHQESEKILENGTKNGKFEAPDIKLINFNKQKLLAAMKAIDDNENIDFSSNQKYRPANSAVRSQTSVTENLYRGLPTHARKKDDLLKEIFGDGKVETKLRGGCSKLH